MNKIWEQPGYEYLKVLAKELMADILIKQNLDNPISRLNALKSFIDKQKDDIDQALNLLYKNIQTLINKDILGHRQVEFYNDIFEKLNNGLNAEKTAQAQKDEQINKLLAQIEALEALNILKDSQEKAGIILQKNLMGLL